MFARCAAALAVLLLEGCTGLPDWKLFARTESQPRAISNGDFDFAWRLSGEPTIAPLQVFDNGRHMWLQFAPERPVPAVFARTPLGDRLLEYRREGPYVVLDQVWPHLILRGGLQSSQVERDAETSKPHLQPVPKAQSQAADGAVALALSDFATPGTHTPKTESAAEGHTQTPYIASPSASLLATMPGISSSLADAAAGLAANSPVDLGANASASVPDTSVPMLETTYEVSPQDQNMRMALVRWAGMAGWTFDSEHWSVDADIPIAGTAQFQSGFKQAVQALMAATELADRPLQPCFYSNKVLRIVPYAQPCNRVGSLSGNS